jgi:transaldolase
MVSLYLDSGDWTLFDKYKVDGITTNPTLLKGRNATVETLVSHAQGKPISLEVVSDDFKDMEAEARKLSALGENIYVKIPITNTKGNSTAFLTQTLSLSGVKVNITAIMTFEQIRTAARSLYAGTPAIISIFAGRIADTGRDPLPFFSVGQACKHDKTKLLWASTREVYNIKQAEQAKVDIITVSPSLLDKIHLFGKDLTEYSLETVKMFYEDGKK